MPISAPKPQIERQQSFLEKCGNKTKEQDKSEATQHLMMSRKKKRNVHCNNENRNSVRGQGSDCGDTLGGDVQLATFGPEGQVFGSPNLQHYFQLVQKN